MRKSTRRLKLPKKRANTRRLKGGTYDEIGAHTPRGKIEKFDMGNFTAYADVCGDSRITQEEPK